VEVAAHHQPFASEGAPGPDGRRIGVLLCHGFTGSPASMVPWGRYLADQGFAVRVPLLPGHGTTWQDANRTGWSDWYGEAERAFEDLRAACDQVVVAGLSMGGCLALLLTVRHPQDVAGVVVVNPWLGARDQRFRLIPVLKRVLASTKANTNDIKKPGQNEHAYDRIPVRAVATMPQMWREVVPNLPRITQPVLHFHSSVDHTIDTSSRDILKAGLSSADVTERVLEDSYHVATLDNDAPQIFEESAAFIRRVTS
jgi:carboxylesterase